MKWGIEVRNVTKKAKGYGKKGELIYGDFNLQVKRSEIVGLIGPNGCGKTTLLNMISGMLKPDAGEILIFDEKPERKKIAYVFQDYRNSLFPWLTVKDNIIFPLALRRMKPKDIAGRLDYITETFGIPFDLEKYPYQLSGGQQQYISILRGLASDPAVMLFDEPFSSLDYCNSLWLMEKMAETLKDMKIPVIIVAHEVEHLLLTSERICFLSGRPADIIMERTVSPAVSNKGRNFDYKTLRETKEELLELYSNMELTYG